ncbi:hypothetical protein [Hymenobacter cavernae]|uniref:Uncharacterized protein n=1 Tax=Hymenobacter cavernae TaxID=2044852 RepID=A0ABQ1UA16_9BACT|nr:hypothetical protein [Hymenobacter cavernae]GGF13831.1 hypothetical protein GCM10011383_26350 [Hymenobacter cavernae]
MKSESIIVAVLSLLLSFLTVLFTNLSSIWGKWIDAQQKKDDHRFSIRNVYVINKIRAGEQEVGNLIILINAYEALETYYRHFKIEDILAESTPFDVQERIKRVNTFTDKIIESASASNNYCSLYFDINQDSSDVDAISSELTEIRDSIDNLSDNIKKEHGLYQEVEIQSEGRVNYADQLKLEIEKYLDKSKIVKDFYHRRILIIREELAKYDIL